MNNHLEWLDPMSRAAVEKHLSPDKQIELGRSCRCIMKGDAAAALNGYIPMTVHKALRKELSGGQDRG